MGSIQVMGVPGVLEAIVADRFTFSPDTGTIVLEGNIIIPLPAGKLKLRSCSINRAGEINDRRSLIDDFQRNDNIDFRLEILPRIARVYSDDELPERDSLLVRIHLLRPHLTWHAPYLPPSLKKQHEVREAVKEVESVKKKLFEDNPWQARTTANPGCGKTLPKDRLNRSTRHSGPRIARTTRAYCEVGQSCRPRLLLANPRPAACRRAASAETVGINQKQPTPTMLGVERRKSILRRPDVDRLAVTYP